jgi:jumonji domain-containing protein 2
LKAAAAAAKEEDLTYSMEPMEAIITTSSATETAAPFVSVDVQMGHDDDKKLNGSSSSVTEIVEVSAAPAPVVTSNVDSSSTEPSVETVDQTLSALQSTTMVGITDAPVRQVTNVMVSTEMVVVDAPQQHQNLCGSKNENENQDSNVLPRLLLLAATATDQHDKQQQTESQMEVTTVPSDSLLPVESTAASESPENGSGGNTDATMEETTTAFENNSQTSRVARVNNQRNSNKPQTRLRNEILIRTRSSLDNGAPSSSSTSSNGQHCLTHTPTLEELQSMSFSNFIRTKVLSAACMYEFNEDVQLSQKEREEFYQNETMELSQGIAKVRLPFGFWKTPPYGNDHSGRGPAWQEGTPLGDLIFSSPIQQNIRGMAGIYEYTHTELSSLTLAEFRDRADKYRIEQMGSAIAFDKKQQQKNNGRGKSHKEEIETEEKDTAMTEEIDGDESGITTTADNNIRTSSHPPTEYTKDQIDELERQFWKRLSPTMPPAIYGADEPGSLFGNDDTASGWSLGNLDTCLHVLFDIPGVTSPYLYAGMWTSVFCAHAEDMNLLSINYLHAGQPKFWYAVAEPDAQRFMALAQHHFIHQFKQCREFLRHKRCMLSPAILKKAGIRYQTAIQYPGDAIITFPGGFHWGFNVGFNLAEATNFGVPEWIPFGRRARVCLCRPDSVRIDIDRLCNLLRRFEKDRKRNKRLTWKEWRKREDRKQGVVSDPVTDPDSDVELKIIRYSPKRKKKRQSKGNLSDQQKRNEFWIEVMHPIAYKGKFGSRNGGSTKKRSSSMKKRMAEQDVWHLAKPVTRKVLEVQSRVLCLVPATRKSEHVRDASNDDSDSSDSGNEEYEEEEDEQCFAGSIVEIADGHARIHLDGLPKTEDIWMPVSSPKLFLDGGRWGADGALEVIPPLHYWQEMDSKKRISAEK